jgi:hypothetical protein
MTRFHLVLTGLVGAALLMTASVRAQEAVSPAQAEFFEKKVRPVLAQHCYKCHSAQAKSVKGGLFLDTRDGLRKGGDSGPAIVPGKPDASLLVKAVRYTDDALQMPPKGKLPAAVVAELEHWVAMGAPDPRVVSAAAKTTQAVRNHWAFHPIKNPPLPRVKHAAWPRTAMDHFILAKLEDHGLLPSPPADKRTLIRRASYDLIGLPPTPEEVDEFLADTAPDAFARVVERLLASPHYGERWGRHWLDVARYADTKDGVLMYGDDRVRPYAYTYRDYVIRALNEDLPFDRFIHEQLAADRIEPKVEPWRLAALGFLTLGRMFDNNFHDIVDDKIDTVSRGLLGLTVACARCHDHKYDPIPTADYYALYGVFASSEAPLELPLIEALGRNPAYAEFEKRAAPPRQELQKFLDSQYTMLLETARQRVGDYLVHAATTKPDPLETAIFFLSLAPTDLRPQMVARWRRFLAQNAQPHDPVFGPWYDLMQLADTQFAAHARQIVESWRSRPTGVGPGQLNPLVRAALDRAKLVSKVDVARTYGDLLRGVYEASKKAPPVGVSAGATAESVADGPAREQLLALVTGPDSPAHFPKSRTRDYMSRSEKDSFGSKIGALDRLTVQSPNAPPRAMVLYDAEQLYEPRVFVRGNPAQPGERVPRQFLRILAGEHQQPFADGSGRLDLAHAITAVDNPLTSRVLVNRVWMHHFGEPLVENPSDYGKRTSAPVQGELLDFLATRLQREGWSLKALHRLVMLSSTYQQASFDRPPARRLDPDNRLLWRMNRQRLDLEEMRDSLLAVSGRLGQQFGGRPVDIVGDPKNERRTVYGLVDRQSLPGLYRAFDFASPDQTAERRPQTTVPQQALFGMNSPFVLEQVRALTARPEVARATSPEQRVTALYRWVLCRRPDADEVQVALRFIAAEEQARKLPQRSQLDPWQQYAQVLLLTNEFMFAD